MVNNETAKMTVIINSIIVIGLTLVIGIFIAANIGTSLQTPNTAGAVVNETHAAVTEAGFTLSKASLQTS